MQFSGTLELSAVVRREGGVYVALCPEFDVASQGKSVEEALTNLKEALELYLEDEDVEKRARNEAGIVLKPRRDWDKVTRRKASIEKARKILGYEPKTEMRAGLKKTYEWILENKDKMEASVTF